MAAKPWLREYFHRLAETITENHLTDEQSLDQLVGFPPPGWRTPKTLLQALEYDRELVRKGYVIQQGQVRSKVDYLLGTSASRWMLDLKRPGENCRRPTYANQLQSYMAHENVPLGVLFNGAQAYAFVSPKHKAVAGVATTITEDEARTAPDLDLNVQPVLSAAFDGSNARELVKFFAMFRWEPNPPDIEALASRLARAYVSTVRCDLASASRSEQLVRAFVETFSSADERLFEAIIGASDSLTKMSAKPRELLAFWQSGRLIARYAASQQAPRRSKQ